MKSNQTHETEENDELLKSRNGSKPYEVRNRETECANQRYYKSNQTLSIQQEEESEKKKEKI